MADRPTFSPRLLQAIRRRFAHVASDPAGPRIYFENAGGTLKLRTVLDTLAEFTALPDNEGRRNAASAKVTAAVERGRADVALFLGATSKVIVADQSATSLIFRLIETVVRHRPRGNIVTTNLEHASAYDATHVIAARHGVEARIAPLDPVRGRVPVESVRNCVDRDTVCLTLIHASNVLGTRHDVAEVVRRARAASPEIFIILDGAQHASHGRIEADEYGGDAYLFVPYKTFAKIGISFAALTERLAALPHDNLRGKPATFWDLGTREPAAYATMSSVVDYYRWLGRHFTKSADPRGQVVAAMSAIERHELELLRALLHGTRSAKGLLQRDVVTVYGDCERLAEREAIVAFNVRGRKTAELVDYFERHGVRLSNRTRNVYSRHTLEALGIEECLRISLAHYNTVREVEVFLQLLAKARVTGAPGMASPHPANLPPGALAIVRHAAVVQPGERVAVIADDRSRAVAEYFVDAAIAVGARAELILIPLASTHGVQPPEDQVAAILEADVALGATTFSLSHTPLRVEFCQQGGRFLSLADYDRGMLEGGGTLADFAATAPVVRRVAAGLEQARTVQIRTPAGSDLRCVVAGRKAMAAPAYCPNPGDFGSPPDIEANITPLEDQTEGTLVVDGSIPLPGIGLVKEPVTIRIERGRAVNVTGGKEAGVLQRVWDAANDPAVRVAAELGIGLNRAARLCGRMLEDEGAYGTVHVGFGSNVTIGGRNRAPLHIDAVCRHATVRTNHRFLLQDGQLVPELESGS